MIGGKRVGSKMGISGNVREMGPMVIPSNPQCRTVSVEEEAEADMV